MGYIYREEKGEIPDLGLVKRLLINGYEGKLGIKLVRAEPTSFEIEYWSKHIKVKHESPD